MHALRKYLEQWAEPEIAFRASVAGPYARALVVPACDETVSLLEGYVAASQTSSGRTLLVLIVNGPEDGEFADALGAANARLLAELRERLRRVQDIEGPCAAFFGVLPQAKLDVLAIDRASPGARLPRKEGVGLARKIGTDLAVALHDAGIVNSPFVFCADADTTLPETHFDLPELDGNDGIAAVLFPFWHEGGAAPEIAHATALYELSLRYHVAGLSHARSPYAFHTIGSSMAVAVPAYASVRGFPKREAAEDFYLLNKIAKIGPVIRLRHSAVRLRARTSARTPFGTGAAVARALAGEPPRFHAPEAYAALGAFVARLDGFVAHADTDRFFAELGSMDETAARPILEVLSELDAKAVLLGAAEEAKSEFQRRIRVHGFFDALRNLKILHRLRDAGMADVSVAEALRAPFSPAPAPPADGSDGHDPDYLVARTAFARSEQKSPMSVGPWS